MPENGQQEESTEQMTEDTAVQAGDRTADEAENPDAELEFVMNQLEDERARAASHWDNLVRTQAEMENLRKRSLRDVENAHKYALEKFASELLAVKDSLELGLSAAKSDGANAEKLYEGTELTLKMFTQVLNKFNIVEVDPTGEPFNPELHQAMSMQESSEKPPNTVLSVMQKGYLLNERLLRPAMVIVSKKPN